ncbi:MAG: DUF1700 domain-containing protein [Eubacteriales bacterium]
MDKFEFTNRLKEALLTKLDPTEIQEQVDFYYNYIEEEVRKGRSEQAVVEELGDPWAIAKNLEGNIGQSAGKSDYNTGTSLEGEDINRQSYGYGANKSFAWSSNSGLGCWLVFGALLLIIIAILYVFVGVVRIFAPILVPVIFILLIIKTFKKK